MAAEHEMMRKALGEKPRGIREADHLTQKEVAKATNAHVNYHARIERGEKTRLTTSCKI